MGLDPPIPLGSSGLFLTEGKGAVEFSRPVRIELTIDITAGPQIAGIALFKFDDAGVTIQPPVLLQTMSNFKLLNIPVAGGALGYETGRYFLRGRLTLIPSVPVLDGRLELNVLSDGSRIDGQMIGQLTIPAPPTKNRITQVIERLAGFPIQVGTVAANVIYLRNPELLRFDALAQLNLPGPDLGVAVRADLTPNLQLHVGDNFTSTMSTPVTRPLVGTAVQQNIFVPPNTPQVIIVLEGSQSAVSYNLVRPDGSTLTPAIGTTEEAAFFQIDNASYYIINNPVPGNWNVQIPDVQGNTFTLEVLGLNNAPVIQVTEPASIGGTDGTIRWIDSDPDNDAEISLFYDRDNTGFDGVLIADGISEDEATNIYTWNLANVPTGEYYIYAMIQDSTNAPSFAYSPGTIGVVNANAPTAPTNFSAAATDSSIRVSWNPSPSAGVLGYTLHYTTDPNASRFDHQVTPIDTTIFEIKGLATGRTYKLAVTAFDSAGFASPFSNPQTVQLVSTTVNNPPAITSKPVPNAVEGSSYTYTVQASDADGNALTFSLRLAPSGMTINGSSGVISWTPDSTHVGVRDVIVTVSDGAASDSQSFVINVAGLAASIGSIQLDQSTYTGINAQALVIVRDVDLNISSAIRDSARVTVVSGVDVVGITLVALETGVNTGVFVGVLGFSTTASSSILRLIRVTSGDTVRVLYHDAHPAGQRVAKAVFVQTPSAPTPLGTFTRDGVPVEVVSLKPILIVGNATPVPGRPTPTYTFAVYRDSLLTDLVIIKSGIPQGTSTNPTHWQVIDPTRPDSIALEDSTLYWWRARANDTVTDGPWSVDATFFTSSAKPVAVELASFTAEATQGLVTVTWRTARIGDVMGFHVYRGLHAQGPFERLTKFVLTGQQGQYQFVDRAVAMNSVYYYQLEAISLDGTRQRFGPVTVRVLPPLTYSLGQSYPNPFNAGTTIRYELPQASKVSITVYNMLGQLVRILVDEMKLAGYYTVVWDGRNTGGQSVASGVYTYRMEAGDFVQTRKMVLVK